MLSVSWTDLQRCWILILILIRILIAVPAVLVVFLSEIQGKIIG